MNHDQFTYWLQGFVEMNGGAKPNDWQWQMIRDHLQLCFVKVTKDFPFNSHGGSGVFGTIHHTYDKPPKGGGGGC